MAADGVAPWTAIVPTYGRPAEVARCLTSLHGQSHPPDRIVVADDSPSDDVRDVAEAAGAVVLRAGGRPSLTRARNAGLRAAATPWVLFIDSDATLPTGAAEQNLIALEAAGAVAGSRVRVARAGPAQRAFWRLFRLPMTGPAALRPRVPPTWTPWPDLAPDTPRWTVHGSNMWLRRDALPRPLFDDRMERYSLWEDLDASLTLHAAQPQARFLTVPVGVDHVPSEDSRLSRPDLYRMSVAHLAWLAWKHAGATRRTDRGVAWSTYGLAVQRARNDPARRAHWMAERRRVLQWAHEHIRPVARDGRIPFGDLFEFMRPA